MSNVDLNNITKRFKGVTALDHISFDIKNGEFFVLLGPTGAGKTTTLRLIAGLEILDEGDISFDGSSIAPLSPAERDVALVFQQYSLYPLLNVYDNLASPLRSPLRKTSETEIRKTVEDVAGKLRIGHLLKRKASNLSGGEMQRVAIGRALVRNPRIYLMDEPLSNLDAKLREALRIELKHLQKTQESTTLFVTHDQIEAMTMADRIAVLNQGNILQVGSPYEIYDHPATTFVAQLVGTPRINLLAGEIHDGNVLIKDSEVKFAVPNEVKLPSSFTLGLRPENVHLDDAGEFSGVIELLEPLGVETILHIRSGKQVLLSVIAGITPRKMGENIRFSIVHERLSFFDKEGTRIVT
ncbi:MAG: ABC transporter ATP-binding protein [Chloroflexota bacterium]